MRIRADHREDLGRARNLSRGGMFVEAKWIAPLQSEVELSFQLPDSPLSLSPTAKVIWSGAPGEEVRTGMGLQFLVLDRASARRIEEYVYERELTQPDLPAPGERPGIR